MKKTLKRAAAIAAGSVLICTVCACSGRADTESGGKLASSYGALIEEQLANGNLSDFETEVLTRARERGTISQSDYEAAHERYKDCMAQSGITAVEHRFPNGLIHHTPPGPDDQFTIEDLASANFSCAVGSIATIDELYRVQVGNPDLLRDTSEAGAACLIREGAAPSTFTSDDFAAAFDGPGSDYNSLPFDVRDERVQMCLNVVRIVIGFAD